MDILEILATGRRTPFPFDMPWFGEAHTAFGFPVVLSDLVYGKVKSIIDDLGAVAVRDLTGTLEYAPSQESLQWYPGIPKLALCVEDRAALKGVGPPRPFVASAWTLVRMTSNNRYLLAYWPFLLGHERHHDSLRRAAEIIGSEISKHRAEPLFEFDSGTNWFSPATPFTPNSVVQLYRKFGSSNLIHAQENRLEVAQIFEIALEGYIYDRSSVYSFEFGEGSFDSRALELAIRSCALGSV